jgi:uroporphyrinogen-III synthase
MKPLAVIRPEPGCQATVSAARALGMQAHGFPLFAIRALSWQAPPPEQFDALLIGSANALRQGGEALVAYRSLPLYTVGETTAQAARAAGFTTVVAGEGGLQALLDTVPPEPKRLLRLTGSERVELYPPPGVTIHESVVYQSAPLPMPDDLAALLASPCVVLLHSAEAARHFAAQCNGRNIVRGRIALAALAQRIADAAGTGWAGVDCPERPRDDALLALAHDMCQTAPSG